MHPFGTDTNERRNLLIILVPVSFWLSAGFMELWSATTLPFPSNFDWIFDAGSAAAWFGVLYLWLEHLGWRWRFLRWIGLVKTPNLNGKWMGELRSSYKNEEKGIVPFEDRIQIHLEVRQSWTQFAIELRSDKSSSKSDTGSIFIDAGVEPIVVYTYLNRPKPDQIDTMEMHAGTSLLELREENRVAVLDGHYYNGRGRGNHGTMHLEWCKTLS